MSWTTGVQWVKQPECEAGNSTTLSAKVKMTGAVHAFLYLPSWHTQGWLDFIISCDALQETSKSTYIEIRHDFMSSVTGWWYL
jgi:hypothetical protein